LFEESDHKKLGYMFKNSKSTEVTNKKNAELMDEEDNNMKITIVSSSLALNNLENIQMFLL
ncbi:15615_t:CDS:1, partial [Cetraspora pellucida]